MADGSFHAQLFDEAWRLVDENYLGARRPFDRAAWAAAREAALRSPPRSRASAHTAISSALSSLGDGYTRFVAPEDFPALTRYDVSGVGLNLGDDSGAACGLRVLGVVLDSPAALAGVRQGDALLAVNGASVAGLSPFQAASAIQALPRSSPLTLRVAPADAPAAARDLVLPALAGAQARDAPPSPVTARLQAGKVGTLQLREFNGVAARDVALALASLQAQGATSYVLDLRDCPGGLVTAGVEVARLFLPSDATVAFAAGRVQAVGGLAQADAQRAAARLVADAHAGVATPAPTEIDLQLRRIRAGSGDAAGPPPLQAPLAVLVNGRTASAAEIVAGALRDNCRAPVVGARTFGKGLIQSVYELSDGSGLVMTVGTYQRPSGETIDQKGLAPDFAAWPGMEAAQGALQACVRPPAQ